MALAAVARERSGAGRAVVDRMDRDRVVLGAMAAVAVGRQVAERALAGAAVARGAVDHRVAAGQRHPGPAVLIERGGVRPRGLGVALGARSVVAALVGIAVAALAAGRRLRPARVAAG